MLDEKQKERLLTALMNHEHSYVYRTLLRDSRSDVIEFAVERSIHLSNTDDKKAASDVLMTLVHCQVEPIDVVTEAYNQGRMDS